MKLTTSILILCASIATSQAAILYFQDFASTATSSVAGVLTDDVGYNAFSGETVTGGSSATQPTDGDYTITLTRATAAGAGDGYILNPSGDPGFQAIDTSYTFETGTVGFTHDSIAYSGTVFVNATAFNVGSEFLSINSVTITQDDVTQEVVLEFNFNGFGDWQPGGNEDINLTTDFGTGLDVAALDIAAAEGFDGNNQTIPDTTYTLVLAEAIVVPEPSSFAFVGLGGLAFLLHRARRS